MKGQSLAHSSISPYADKQTKERDRFLNGVRSNNRLLTVFCGQKVIVLFDEETAVPRLGRSVLGRAGIRSSSKEQLDEHVAEFA